MKKVFLILLIILIVLSFSIPFAYASDGDTKAVQFYNYSGIVMPDINEIWSKTEYPYVCILASGNLVAYVYFCNVPFVYNSDTDYIMTQPGAECSYYYGYLNGTEYTYVLRGDVQWQLSDIKTGSDLQCIKVGSKRSWSNHDIYYSGDAQVYCAASEPVIDKVVDYEVNPVLAPMYDYGGIVVPDISTSDAYNLTDYPYILMYQSGQSIYIYFANVPFYIQSSVNTGYLYIRSSAAGQYIRISRNINYLLNGFEWGTADPTNVSAGYTYRSFKDDDFSNGILDGQLIWSNVNLVGTDGFVYYRTVLPFLVDDTPDIIDNVDTMVNSSIHWINSLSFAIVQTPFIFAFVLVAFVGLSIRIILRLKK